MRDVTLSENLATLHLLGYAVSVAALGIGLFIFIRFKDLRCVRNTIHIHLMLTYLLLDTCWLLAATSQMLTSRAGGQMFCSLVLIFHFLHLANFSWMFMEGLYLYLSVVKTFSVEKIKLRLYLLLGWALPLPFVTTWAALRAAFSNQYEHRWRTQSSNTSHTVNCKGILQEVARADFDMACPWLEESPLDWVHRAPVLLVLGVNTFFLIHVMVVLVKKLRATTSLESQPWLQQTKRALKSLFVLMPLLGSPHVLLLLAPARGTFSAVVAYMRAIVLSTQGLVVTVFYCFLNAEVQESLSNHMKRWKSTRDVPPGSCPYSANYQDSVVTRNCVLASVGPEKTSEFVPLRTFAELRAIGEPTENVEGNAALPVFPPAFPHIKKTRDSTKRNRRSPSIQWENAGMNNSQVHSSETSDSSTVAAIANAASSPAQEAHSRVMQQNSGTNTKDIIQPLAEVVAMC
ncbi:diuretic hormone receptor-like [Penaeus vannamei]|uniref:diuretic hormone receptor-like n=1 Tax=Penaeus vannamei TaxID=6689 RepID=UPI00387F9F9B